MYGEFGKGWDSWDSLIPSPVVTGFLKRNAVTTQPVFSISRFCKCILEYSNISLNFFFFFILAPIGITSNLILVYVLDLHSDWKNCKDLEIILVLTLKPSA